VSAFDLTTTAIGGLTRIDAAGDLDLVSAPRLEEELRRVIARSEGSDVLLDLRAVSFIDSSGLRAILVGSRAAAAAGITLRLCPGDGQVLRVIELAQVGDHLTLVEEPNGEQPDG
jgi:anti-anti-sigma factor